MPVRARIHWYPPNQMRRILLLVSAVSLLAPILSTTFVRADDTEANRPPRRSPMPASGPTRPPTRTSHRFADRPARPSGDPAEVRDRCVGGRCQGAAARPSRTSPSVATPGRAARACRCSPGSAPEDQIKVDALLDVIYDSSANDFDRFDALNADLADKRQRLVDKKARAEQERSNLAALKDAATAEVQRLKDVEADRLKDDAVRVALIAEQARRKRDADRKRLLSAPPPTVATISGHADHGPRCA